MIKIQSFPISIFSFFFLDFFGVFTFNLMASVFFCKYVILLMKQNCCLSFLKFVLVFFFFFFFSGSVFGRGRTLLATTHKNSKIWHLKILRGHLKTMPLRLQRRWGPPLVRGEEALVLVLFLQVRAFEHNVFDDFGFIWATILCDRVY